MPTSFKKVSGFLESTSFYHRFLRNFSTIVRPLTDLNEKDSFHWSTVAQQDFKGLKEALSSMFVITTPNFTRHFNTKCDSSKFGLKEVFLQDDHPIAFESYKSNDKEKRVSTYNKKMLAILHEVASRVNYF
jgi:hypothetical protein